MPADISPLVRKIASVSLFTVEATYMHLRA
jgi:hypothetical protein